MTESNTWQYLFAVGSVLFLTVFLWLRYGLNNWYRTTGKIIKRRRFGINPSTVIEYTDAAGKLKQGPASEIANFFPRRVRVRVSPRGSVHVEGSEWFAFALFVFLLSMIFLV